MPRVTDRATAAATAVECVVLPNAVRAAADAFQQLLPLLLQLPWQRSATVTAVTEHRAMNSTTADVAGAAAEACHYGAANLHTEFIDT